MREKRVRRGEEAYSYLNLLPTYTTQTYVNSTDHM